MGAVHQHETERQPLAQPSALEGFQEVILTFIFKGLAGGSGNWEKCGVWGQAAWYASCLHRLPLQTCSPLQWLTQQWPERTPKQQGTGDGA